MDIPALLSSSFIRVKLVTLVHTILVVLSLFGVASSQAYLFYNLLFILSLFWTIHCKESIDAVHTAALIDALSILFDLFAIVVYFSYGSILSGIFAILNLVARPFSVLLLHRELIDRGGNFMGTSSSVSPGDRQYQDIEGSTQTVPTNNQDLKNMF